MRSLEFDGQGNDPLSVSVIVPVFQDQDGVKNFLCALEVQTYPRHLIDVVVVDNGSSPPLALDNRDSHGFEVRLIRCEKPGSYAARNAGALVADGQVFAFSDADCVPDPEWLENGIKALITVGGDSLIGGEVSLLNPAAQTAVSIYQRIVGFQQRENINNKFFSVTANLFCTREMYSLIGPFHEGLLSGGDLEWGGRARRYGVETRFAPDAIVRTPPRISLRAAVRQARRVAAGRYYLKRYGLTDGDAKSLNPHRGPFSSILWIMRYPELPLGLRISVLTVASIIKMASVFEVLRIRLGGRAERR